MKPIRIINACIEVFAVTSMLLQRIINESSLKKQWNMKDSELNTTKTIKIKIFPNEIINVSNESHQRIINDYRRSSNEASKFRRLGQNKILSLMFASKSSKSYQRFFIGSSTINQSSIKGTSTFWWLSHYKLQWSLPIASKPS